MDSQENYIENLEVKLRLTGQQHQELFQHLFPGDSFESVALALCGTTRNLTEEKKCLVLTVHKVILIPDNNCLVRTPERVTWSTELLPELLKEAIKYRLCVLKIHSHPGGYREFSNCDNVADRELFTGVGGWLDIDIPGASAVMLPGGQIFGRCVSDKGDFIPITTIAVAGDDIQFWKTGNEFYETPAYAARTMQTFGPATTALLSTLSVAVVGCSGTGSPLVEMLTRLGVGEIVVVDPDRVEEKNLNRIYNATIEDAKQARYKVDVLADAIKRMGLGTKVVAIPKDLFHPDVARRIALCDVVFGCMDSVDGRDLLNRLSAFYSIPYFDVGVRLTADGKGGVDQVCGTVHYLQPGGSSLLSRGLYTPEKLQAAALHRANPNEYARQLKEGYIQGVEEDRPAVIHVNTNLASFTINEFLARLHPFRDDNNSLYASVTISLSQMRFIFEQDGAADVALLRYVGRGDMRPLLNMPVLSEKQ